MAGVARGFAWGFVHSLQSSVRSTKYNLNELGDGQQGSSVQDSFVFSIDVERQVV